ncbi:chlororespiratory reduction protein 7 [Cyanobacterium stanieri LEGE 03274]|uniref:Chlororespiratory reduction protein 7 n=1 Tax=Cyanobacterium stanieri LEGE 03274 TaxID=1828756 RepID=A0ABR9V083_9CHRO|nr:chlororespiratory reduction protein 7 [Cyanobacterium stanieri]MBE9221288.1 chlororespiratory reduction protein 7 [Cyanobacterium stanieri LEGE 03274]
MADSIMYQEDGFVVLENDQPEQLMSRTELLNKLEKVVTNATDLPRDVAQNKTMKAQAEYLLENYCEFNPDENSYLQWYVVRWEKK